MRKMRDAEDVTSRAQANLIEHREVGVPRTLLWIQLAGTVLAVLVVLFVEGIGVIALWNIVPVVLALGSIAIARGPLGSMEVRTGAFAFWASQIVSVTLLHVAWKLDWGGVATRSSTAGLIFLVAPVYAVTGGLLVAGLTILASLGLRRWNDGGA
jgi:hypothetical protein